jgi:hypothetical protein
MPLQLGWAAALRTMPLSAAPAPLDSSQEVFSTPDDGLLGLGVLGLWAIGTGLWFLILHGASPRPWLLDDWTFFAIWKLGIFVGCLFTFGAEKKNVFVQPSTGKWSLSQRKLLRATAVETYCARDIEKIRISTFQCEPGNFWIDVCNRDGRRINITGSLLMEQEAEEVALAFARPLGLADKIVRLPCA